MRSPRSTTALFLALLLLSKNSCHSFVVVPMPQTTTTTARNGVRRRRDCPSAGLHFETTSLQNNNDNVVWPRKNLWLPLTVSTILTLGPLIPLQFHPPVAAAAAPPMEHVFGSTTTSRSLLTTETMRTAPIMDLAQVLSNHDQLTILQVIDRAEQSTATEIQVILVNQIPDTITPKQMATTLFNKWRIGPAGKNNGVLILAVVDQRRVEIEVGRGIGKVMNSNWCTTILKEEAVPQFRKGQYGEGIVKILKRVTNRLEQIDRQRMSVLAKREETKIRPSVATYLGVLAPCFTVGAVTAAALIGAAEANTQDTKARQESQSRNSSHYAFKELIPARSQEKIEKEELMVRRAREWRERVARGKRKKSRSRSRVGSRRSSTYVDNSQSTSYNSYTRYSDKSRSNTSKNTSDDGGSSWSAGGGDSGFDSGGSSSGDGGGADW